MNIQISMQARARLFAAVMAIVALCAVTWQPASAASVVENREPAPAKQIGITNESSHAFLPAAKRTLTTTITDTTFGDDAVCVDVQVLAKNLKGADIRAGIFFFYEDGSFMEAGSEADPDFVTSSGFLTSQLVYTSGFTNSKWKNSFCVPYTNFPTVEERTSAFIEAQSGLDGQKFVSFSDRAYFNITPN